jgi:DNA processing protein
MMTHEMSMKAGIPTIAILGGGLKRFLESKSREIIQKIIDHGGLVISEFKLNKEPERYTFPQRNRIVAGLADMIFLPEAGEKSGSLITVDFARQMHKDVYGAPNTIFSPLSKGLLQYMQQ